MLPLLERHGLIILIHIMFGWIVWPLAIVSLSAFVVCRSFSSNSSNTFVSDAIVSNTVVSNEPVSNEPVIDKVQKYFDDLAKDSATRAAKAAKEARRSQNVNVNAATRGNRKEGCRAEDSPNRQERYGATGVGRDKKSLPWQIPPLT